MVFVIPGGFSHWTMPVNKSPTPSMAKWVLRHVQSFGIQSINAVKRNKRRAVPLAEHTAHDSLMAQIDAMAAKSNNAFDAYRAAAAMSQQEHRGNCGSKAAVAFEGLIERYPSTNTRFEIIALEGGDHEFVVIGRDPKSDIANYRTWGRDVWVADTWTEEFYPASEIPNRLPSSCREEENLNIIYSMQPFDPTKHSFFQLTTNLYLPEEIPDFEGTKIHKLLKEVHAEKDFEKEKS